MFRVSYHGVLFPIRRAETIIGRSTYCSIVIPSEAVSREHARLLLSNATLELSDLGSSNGTTVNGERLTHPRVVQAGDVIGLGSELLLLSLGERGAPGPTGPLSVITKDEFPTMKTQTSTTIEVVERMVANAAATPDPRVVAGELRRAIDWLVQGDSFKNDRSGRIRLMAVAEIVASWSKNGEMDEWRHAVSARLGFGGA